MVNSKQKGARGEREWSNFCKEHGYDTRRTAQYCGNNEESADVIGLPGIHIEVKRYSYITHNLLVEFLGQSVKESQHKNIPIVAHKEDYAKWHVTMDAVDLGRMLGSENDWPYIGSELCPVTMLADDWFRIYKEWEVGQCASING